MTSMLDQLRLALGFVCLGFYEQVEASWFCLASFILDDFLSRAIDVSAVVWQVKGETPCACCVVCPTTGSRTVVLFDT